AKAGFTTVCTNCAREATKSVASAAGASGRSECRRISRMRSPTGVPPGSRYTAWVTPSAVRRAERRWSWVDFPAPSPPSKTSSWPRKRANSAQRDDRTRRALLDALEHPLVHLLHHLVEVLVGGDEALV